jgi:hypothetical protein
MRAQILSVGLILAVAAGLSGCQPKNTSGALDWAPDRPGRYAGLGVYPTGSRWAKVAVSGQPSDPAAARTIDDEHVIVVIDSKTGEVRQCGNLSGYCIGMNPWAKPLGTERGLPVLMTSHADAAADAASAEPKRSELPARPRRHHDQAASSAEIAPTSP